jgi:hypothetical protein
MSLHMRYLYASNVCFDYLDAFKVWLSIKKHSRLFLIETQSLSCGGTEIFCSPARKMSSCERTSCSVCGRLYIVPALGLS